MSVFLYPLKILYRQNEPVCRRGRRLHTGGIWVLHLQEDFVHQSHCQRRGGGRPYELLSTFLVLGEPLVSIPNHRVPEILLKSLVLRTAMRLMKPVTATPHVDIRERRLYRGRSEGKQMNRNTARISLPFIKNTN